MLNRSTWKAVGKCEECGDFWVGSDDIWKEIYGDGVRGGEVGGEEGEGSVRE